LGDTQRFMGAVDVLGEMADAGVDMGRQLDVIGRGRKAKSTIEMPLGEPVMATSVAVCTNSHATPGHDRT
jgi:hypothetical protein